MTPSQKPQDGGAAFAHSGTDGHEGYPGNLPQAGMSLRDWIAGQCMAACFGASASDPLTVAEGESVDQAMFNHWFDVSKGCYAAADAMLLAREAQP